MPFAWTTYRLRRAADFAFAPLFLRDLCISPRTSNERNRTVKRLNLESTAVPGIAFEMTAVTTTMLFMEPWPPEPRPSNEKATPSSPVNPSSSEKVDAPSQTKYEPPYLRGHPTPEFPQTTNFTNTAHSVTVHPARAQKPAFSLDQHGFAFPPFPSDSLSPEVLSAIRNGDKDTVEKQYYPTVVELLMQETGASKVVIFDHTYRKRDPEVDMEKKENAYKRGQPATVVSSPPWTDNSEGRTCF